MKLMARGDVEDQGRSAKRGASRAGASIVPGVVVPGVVVPGVVRGISNARTPPRYEASKSGLGSPQASAGMMPMTPGCVRKSMLAVVVGISVFGWGMIAEA
jgi:hypothetical protein